MRFKYVSLFFASAFLGFIALNLHAETIKLKATLTAASEVPAKDTSGKGEVTATLDTETKVFHYDTSFSDLTGPATAAHFHGPAGAGVNAKPTVPLKSPVESPFSGEATLIDEQVKDLLAGQWYLNVHTTKNPGGEIRGQLVRE
jgi:hypothetical protein